MMRNSARVQESRVMNGGDGKNSYQKNSFFQRYTADAVTEKIQEAIAENLDVKSLLSSSKAFRIADFGCATGPNTFIAMENVIQSVKKKYQSQCSGSEIPEFHVFFNDQVTNDFNTLFTTLPPDGQYFAAGVPGSFYDRLLPESSLHFAYSSNALHHLPMVQEELLDENSPSWNGGRVHYVNAPDAVVDVYAAQFAKGMNSYLDARAKEIVSGGLMVMHLIADPPGIPHSQTPAGVSFDLYESTFLDMQKEGIISKAQLDSFNLQTYSTTLQQMTKLVETNGCFKIETLEFTKPMNEMPNPIAITPSTWHSHVKHSRAAREGYIRQHFGGEITDELFDRLLRKYEFRSRFSASMMVSSHMLVILKRK